jgi:hypothetical protein
VLLSVWEHLFLVNEINSEINRTSMIINCEAHLLVGKADALALLSTQGSPIITLIQLELTGHTG